MSGYSPSARIAILLLTAAAGTGLAGSAARAAEPLASEPRAATVQVNIQSCKVYRLDHGKYAVASKPPLRPGQQLTGRLHQSRKDLFVTRVGATTFAVPTSCVEMPEAPPEATPRAKAEASRPSPLWARFEPRFRFLFYQERVTVSDPSAGAYEITGHFSGVCPGVGYRQDLSALFTFVADLCVIFGTADARGFGTTETSNITYEYDHALTIGARLVPGVEMPFAGRDFRVGIGVPIVFRTGSWGTTESGATASTSGLLFPGALLTFQGTRDRFGFIADFGFVKKLTATMYSIGLSYRL